MNSKNVFLVDQTLYLFEQPWGSSEKAYRFQTAVMLRELSLLTRECHA